MQQSNYNLQNLNETVQREFKKADKKPFIIAIDGRGGSGKSTLAKKLEINLEKTKRYNLDAFTARNGDFFSDDIIAKKYEIDFENTEYKITDLKREILKSKAQILILEGSFSFKNLADIDFDLKILVDCKKKVAKDRLNNREINERTKIDPKIIKLSTKKWQEAEDRYYETFNPQEKADIIIDTTKGYQLLVDSTEWTGYVKIFKNLIPIWWQEKFGGKKLESIKFAGHGMNCSYILNQKYVLKIYRPKYNWDKEINNYKAKQRIKPNLIIQNIQTEFIPRIYFSEFSETLNSYYVLSAYKPSQELYNLYYKATFEEKQAYLQNYIRIIRDFHEKFQGYIHGDLHFSNILIGSDQKMYLIDFDNLEKGQPFDELYGIMQGLLLPSCCVSEELEEFYQEPMIEEFKTVIKQYPKLLPVDKIEDAKKIFKDCFDQKLIDPKFKKQLEPVYKMVFEEGLFENLTKNL